MKNILDLDATTLAEQIRSGTISSVEATHTYIDHIKKVNPHLNAMVEDRFEEALKEAEEKDSLRKKGQVTGRLFGVPISIEEAFSVKGMKTTSGLPNRINEVDTEDAEIVRRLKEEGAIILGKTNTPPLLLSIETDNTVYGRTNNPWDLSRTPGGCSGGEGALIAVGGAAVGIGSDLGGSIRITSHCNGVIGFKSGKDQVSDEGHFPQFSPSNQAEMQGFGAIAKSVDDAQLIFEITANCFTEKQKIEDFRFIVPEPDSSLPMQSTTSKQIDMVREYLRSIYTVSEEQPPFLRESAEWWQFILSITGGEDWSQLSNKKTKEVFRELFKSKIGIKYDIHPHLAKSIIAARLFKPGEEKIKRILNELERAKSHIFLLLEKAVLILPVFYRTAPKHGELYGEVSAHKRSPLKYMPFLTYANTFGLPALVLPVGEDEHGLPIAVQLITLAGQEHALFEAGRILEEKFRGYKRCTKYD